MSTRTALENRAEFLLRHVVPLEFFPDFLLLLFKKRQHKTVSLTGGWSDKQTNKKYRTTSEIEEMAICECDESNKGDGEGVDGGQED